MTADVLTKSLPQEKHNHCMIKLGMCLIPQSQDQISPKIQALMTYVPFSKFCTHPSDLCGSPSTNCIYCSSSSIDTFLEPFLNNYASTIQKSSHLDSSWSGRHITHPINHISKTNQCDNFLKNKSPIIRYNRPYNGQIQYQASTQPIKVKNKNLPQNRQHPNKRDSMLIHPKSIHSQQYRHHQTSRYSKSNKTSSINNQGSKTFVYYPKQNTSTESKVIRLIHKIKEDIEQAAYKLRVLTTYLNLKAQYDGELKNTSTQTDGPLPPRRRARQKCKLNHTPPTRETS